MILLNLKRLQNNGVATIGSLRLCDVHLCYVIEDAPRPEKIKGKTRIPAGRYKIAFRKYGGFHNKYSDRFPDMHKGMIELQDVPDFKYILIHIGNFHGDTDGCLLVGESVLQQKDGNPMVTSSEATYRRVYPVLASLMRAGILKEILVEDERAE